MPTIHRERGIRFLIYLDDHEPAHVHLWHGGLVAKIQIGDASKGPSIVDPGSVHPTKVRQALRIIEANQEHFLAKWRDYHGT
jgi:hypothetical protein